MDHQSLNRDDGYDRMSCMLAADELAPQRHGCAARDGYLVRNYKLLSAKKAARHRRSHGPGFLV